ncbi:TIGR04222 domain-containing membrane protein [Streptomyces globosus]|uniref:TIGR04222 domain-containing membrane protein n=1 Tax=Streptomyces globosus TaxID=68209 RepID=UPI0024822663|nr:TIGR04222 domain-containing membrane protein [Streptomyces globosus]
MTGFAVVWLPVAVSSVLLVWALRRTRPRTGGEPPRLLDLSEAAFLTGGPGGVVDTALVVLLGDGRLTAGGPGIVQARPGAPAADTAERAVLRACGQAPSGRLYQVRYAAMRDPAVQEVGDGLAARGLLTAPGRGRGVRVWGVVQAAVCGVLFLLSLPLVLFTLAVSGGGGVPAGVSLLFALPAGAVVGAVCARRAARRVTPRGRRALRAMRAVYVGDGSPQAQTALFGLRTLRDPYLGPLLVPAARQARLAAAEHRAQGGRSGRSGGGGGGSDGCGSSGAEAVPVVWCAGSGGGSGCGSSGDGGWGGSGCGSSGGSSCSSSSSSSSCSSSSSS